MPNPSNLPQQPVALQGVNPPGYSAQDLRRLALAGPTQEGVIAAGDFKISQRAAGAGLAVDVAAGEALVQGDSVTSQGLYYALLTAALTGATEVTVPAGDGANPRIDQLVLEVKDTAHDGSGLNVGRVRLVQGTPTSGATLDNRLGAAALPPNARRLADLLMPAGGVQATNANIRDRRTWARGALVIVERNVADYTTLSTTYVDVDATTLKPRVEMSGVPTRVALVADREVNAASSPLRLVEDAASRGEYVAGAAGAKESAVAHVWLFTPSAGSRVYAPQYRSTSASFGHVLRAAADRRLFFVLEELVRQNADNG